MEQFIFTHECDECGATMKEQILIMGNEPGTIPVAHVSQMTFTCPECGLTHYTGDMEILNENKI